MPIEIICAFVAMGWLAVIMGWCWLMGYFDESEWGFFIEVMGIAGLIWLPAAYLIHIFFR